MTSTDYDKESLVSTDYDKEAISSTDYGLSAIFTDNGLLFQDGTSLLLLQDEDNNLGLQT